MPTYQPVLRHLESHAPIAPILDRRNRDPAPCRASSLSEYSGSEPWSARSRDTPENRALQRRLMEVALDRLEREPFIAGMFWWKWMPGSRYHGDFSMHHPGVVEVVWWAWGEAPQISAE